METAFLINRINKWKQGSCCTLGLMRSSRLLFFFVVHLSSSSCQPEERGTCPGCHSQQKEPTKTESFLGAYNRGEVNNTHFYTHRCVAKRTFFAIYFFNWQFLIPLKGDKFRGMLLFQPSRTKISLRRQNWEKMATTRWMGIWFLLYASNWSILPGIKEKSSPERTWWVGLYIMLLAFRILPSVSR